MTFAEKLDELERRLIGHSLAHRRDRFVWTLTSTDTYEWAGGKGNVEVSRDRIRILDPLGHEDHSYQPATDDLYQTVRAAHAEMVVHVIDGILADLEHRTGTLDQIIPRQQEMSVRDALDECTASDGCPASIHLHDCPLSPRYPRRWWRWRR